MSVRKLMLLLHRHVVMKEMILLKLGVLLLTKSNVKRQKKRISMMI